MKEKLIIKNFGPIKSVDLNIGKITVLIGEQATGKSTIAKVLSICRYFSYIVDDSELITNYASSFSNTALSDWGLSGFERDDSYIKYNNKDYQVEIKNYENFDNDAFNPNEELIKIPLPPLFKPTLSPISDRFKKLFNDYQKLKPKREGFGIYPDWHIPHSFLTTDVKSVMNNPLFIPTERSLQSTAFSKGLLISNAELDALGKLSRIATKFKETTSIKPLSLIYKNENNIGYIKKENEESYYELHNAASGYKATIPIVLAVKYYNEIRRRKTFIIEEPELNLFPKVQNKLMQFFVENINVNKHSFLIPTHSPYILTTLGNLIYAHKLGTSEKGMFEKEVAKIIPKKSWIDVKDVSVYYLNNGEAKDLVDVEECLINLDDLDNVSEIINKEFDALLEIDIALEKEIK